MTVREIEVGDGTLRVRVVGSGPPVVLVHGALVDGRLWDGVVARLQDRFTCVVPEMPLGAHTLPLPAEADRTPAGNAQRLARLLEALGLWDVTLVGNDSGGAICQVLAASWPERVGRMVLTNCDALDVFPPAVFAWLGLIVRFPWAMGALVRAMNAMPVLARGPTAYGWLADEIPDEVLGAWLAAPLDPAVRRDVAGFFLAARPQVTLEAAEALGDWQRPVLLAWGRRDRFFRPSLAERLAAKLPRARIEWFDARTFVALDQPEALALAIARHATAGRATLVA